MKIYIISLDEIKKISIEKCYEFFPKRMKNVEKFRKEEDKLRSIGAGYLIHNILKISEDEINKNQYGKPFTDKIWFNISHSGEYVALAVDDYPIGTDIEKIDERHIKVAKKVFNEKEIEWMSVNAVDRFFVLWTLKESIMKAEGLGMQLSPDSFSVMNAVNGKSVEINKKWYCQSIKINNHILSIATINKYDNITLENIEFICF